MLKIGERKLKNKKDNITAALFILLSSIFVSIPLIKFNIQYDDGIQHVARLIETAREISNGNFIAYIMQNLCNGFGYSWNLFYSPLTSYLPLVFRIFGFSFENCLRIFMFFVSILSGYSMYFFMKKTSFSIFTPLCGRVRFLWNTYSIMYNNSITKFPVCQVFFKIFTLIFLRCQ